MKKLTLLLIICLSFAGCSIRNEIKNAFQTVNVSIERSNYLAHGEIDSLKKSIDSLYTLDSAKWTDAHKKTEMVIKLSDSLSTFIAALSDTLDSLATGDADINITTKLFVKGPSGIELKSRLEKYISDIHSVMAPYNTTTLPMSIELPATSDNYKISWQERYFNSVPKIAASVILNKFKNDVHSSEIFCLKELLGYKQIG